jgi:Cu/Ag efflux protein CusF
MERNILMKIVARAAFLAALALSSISTSHAQALETEATTPDAMSAGEVRKVDKGAGKITIKHGPLGNIGMDAMTMVFRASKPEQLKALKAGDKVRFRAESDKGALVVTHIEAAK